jgi:lipopolysaccharide biosynthesis regulator YciM
VNLGQFILLLVILGSIFAFIGVPWWMARKRETAPWNPAHAYLAALDALIRAEKPAAIPPLRELAQRDPANVGAFIRLGDLVRRMGYPERAHRIHADLLARAPEDPEDLRRLQESVLEDLLLLDRPEELARVAEQVLAVDRRHPLALRAMVRSHVAREDWDAAIRALDEWNAVAPGATAPTQAQLRIHVAGQHLAAGRYRESEKLLDEASRMEGDGALAHVLLGDLHAQEGDLEAACEEWTRYLREHGHRSDLVLARLEKAYFEMGRFGDLMPVYEQLAGSKGGNVPAGIALADMHRRRGRFEEAVRQFETVLDQQPDHRYARRQLIGSLLQVGRTEQALRELDHLLNDLNPGDREGTCPSCGSEITDILVRCPKCDLWLDAVRPWPAPRPRVLAIPAAD